MFRAIVLFFVVSSSLVAQTVIDVWPEGKMPGAGAKEAETEVKRQDGFLRITNVSKPTLTFFKAERPDGSAAPALIVCPGGGYGYCVMDKEGSEIAAWLNKNGISALVLKYRTPNNREGAFQDVQRALSLVRANAVEWKIDPKRLGVIGFSAGGNLAAKASAPVVQRSYLAVDVIDQTGCQPDFGILVYPAYLDDKSGQVASDLKLTADMPATLIIHSEDDKRHIIGSKVVHEALKRAKIAHEFKLYATGGHGYGLRCERDAKVWPEDALKWLKSIGVSQ
ncbi:MAG: alpha/beta hydrolase [Verrucomicrobiaceae bacterium]|nr:alpha/beta hydrolase [Verrucomicrobiaceae bacterium]